MKWKSSSWININRVENGFSWAWKAAECRVTLGLGSFKKISIWSIAQTLNNKNVKFFVMNIVIDCTLHYLL
jgi:hypothetical protein